MKFAVVLALTLAVASQAQAQKSGKIGSGGGKGIVCRDQQNKIKSVELLDLWEARVFYNYNIVNDPRPVNEQVHDAIEVLKYSYMTNMVSFRQDGQKNSGANALKDELAAKADLFLDRRFINTKWLRNIKLTPTQDSFEDASPNFSGCEIEQIVVYKNNGEILINEDIYESMSNTQKAALISHEVLYSSLRRRLIGEVNSLRVRRTIGMVFGGQKFTTEKDFQVKDKVYCRSADSYNRKDSYHIEILELGPKLYLSQKYLYKINQIAGLPVIGGFGSLGSFSEFGHKPDENLLNKLVKGAQSTARIADGGTDYSLSFLDNNTNAIEAELVADSSIGLYPKVDGTMQANIFVRGHSQLSDLPDKPVVLKCSRKPYGF